MQSLILLGSESNQQNYLQSFIHDNMISPYRVKTVTETVKISDVHEIIRSSRIKMGSAEKRVIVLSDSITIPAQNALLKFLEELSDDTFVFFLVKSKDQLLETILSRSQVVNVGIARTDSTLLKNLSTLRKDQDIAAALFIYAASISTLQEYEQFLLAVRTTILQRIINGEFSQLTAIFKVLRHLNLQYQIVKENNINPKFTVEMGYSSKF